MYLTTHHPIIDVLLPMFQKMETLNHLTISAFANVKADISTSITGNPSPL
jgi:hypothetical protein